MDEWTESIVESMSTLELGVALVHADDPENPAPPAIVALMTEEWRERPAKDRIKAEAALDGRIL